MFSKLFKRNKMKTVRTLKSHAKKKRQELSLYSKTTCERGNMRDAVRLPDGENADEWLAVHTVDFYNEINLLYGSIMEACTMESCPKMLSGQNLGSKDEVEYLWMDDTEEYKKPTRVPAPKYVKLLMKWVESIICDNSVFPAEGDSFPKKFKHTISRIFRRLFRVFVHIYVAHIDAIKELDAEAELNTCFKHFYLFVTEFKLIEKSQLKPLKRLIQGIMEEDSEKKSNS